MTAFVILHYMAESCTVSATESVRAINGEKHIIIVDNCSPNGSGLSLVRRYADCPDVTVLLNSENSGYARGNNFGIEYALRKLDPEFVVVMNNDVELLQLDFCERIKRSYERHPFHVLGPDILSVFSNTHQSPKRIKPITLEFVRAKKRYLKRSLNPILLYLSSGEKSCAPIYRWHLQKRSANSGINRTVESKGAVLHGACVIFSRRWLMRHPRPFCDDTYMYFEMEILDYLGRREGYVSIYDPTLKVKHLQNVSTAASCRSIIKQTRFVINNLLKSCEVAERLILEDVQEDCLLPAYAAGNHTV